MPQLSEVATIGASLVNPYASTPDSIESRAWMLWRAAVGIAQRTGSVTEYDHAGLMTTISLRKVAKDLFAGVPGDLAAVYADLKERGNARCVERGGRGDTPIWWFRREFNVSEPTAVVTQLPVEAPELPKPVAKTKPKARSRRSQARMSAADLRASILKVLSRAEHPLYAEEIADRLKRHITTVRPHLLELANDERAFRRHETLDERGGTPGRRHHLYWATADIPIRPAELFKSSQRKSGRRSDYVVPPKKTVLRRVEELVPGHHVSLNHASSADLVSVQELIDGGVIEYVNPVTKKEVRLTGTAPRTGLENGLKSRVIDGKPFAGAPAEPLGKSRNLTTLNDQLEQVLQAEVDRRVEVRVANEVAELERRLAQSEGQRVAAQTELEALKGRVQSLLG